MAREKDSPSPYFPPFLSPHFIYVPTLFSRTPGVESGVDLFLAPQLGVFLRQTLVGIVRQGLPGEHKATV